MSGGSISGRNYSGKNVRRQKSKGHLPWEYFMRVNCQGVIIQEENPGGKSAGCNCSGANFIGGNCLGSVVVQEDYLGVIVRGKMSRE